MHVRGMHLNKITLFFLISASFFTVSCTKINTLNFIETISNDAQFENYDVESVTYKFQNEYQYASIEYPKLKPNYSIQNLDKINELIKTKIFELCQFDETYVDYDNYEDEIGINYLELTLHYEIKYLSEHYMSIIFQGFFNPKRAPHGTHLFYTLNIDLKNSKLIKLRDMVIVDKNFLEIFKEKIKNSRSKYDPEVFESLNNISYDKILKKLELADELEKNCDIFSYFTDKHVCVSYPIPFTDGYHTIIKLDIERFK